MLKNENSHFHIASEEDFHTRALQLFKWQFQHNLLYREWVQSLRIDPSEVQNPAMIPFLPIEFFKSHEVLSAPAGKNSLTFESSGTTGSTPSRHIVTNPQLYRESFLRGFRLFYGEPAEYCILALLPGYLERGNSSLVYMVKELAELSAHPDSGFYLRNTTALKSKIKEMKDGSQKVLLIGVSYALLDLCETGTVLSDNFIVMETGGMKGTRKEMLKQELHQVLRRGLGISHVHSEYGMTELLSQAYSRGDGLFESPPWMRFFIRETDDPLKIREDHRTGGVNVIDLANINSCAFIATKDLGRLTADGKLELMGRFDNSDIRGCNLMVQGL